MSTYAALLEELELTEVQESVEQILGGNFRFRDTVLDLLSEGRVITVEEMVEAVTEQLVQNWQMEKELFFSVLALGIAAALLSNFSYVFKNRQIAEVSFEITYLLLFLLLLQVFSGAVEVAQGVLEHVLEFMRALIPAFSLAVTMAFRGTTALVFYQFLLGLIYLSQWLISGGVMTLIQVHMMLVFINHLSKEEYLSQMSELMSRIIDWVLKSLLALVIGFNTIQGILNPAIDALKATALSRTAEMIPGIGNLAGGVTDVILGSAVLIKNGIGAAALLVLVWICLIPLSKLGILILILELAAAVIQPVSDKRMVGCVSGTGAGIRLLFRAVFTTAVLFLLTVVVVTVSTGRG